MDERVSAVTAALIGPYVGMKFILKNGGYILMTGFENCVCEVISIGIPNEYFDGGFHGGTQHGFFFKIVSPESKACVPPMRENGWICWKDVCWENSIIDPDTDQDKEMPPQDHHQSPGQ